VGLSSGLIGITGNDERDGTGMFLRRSESWKDCVVYPLLSLAPGVDVDNVIQFRIYQIRGCQTWTNPHEEFLNDIFVCIKNSHVSDEILLNTSRKAYAMQSNTRNTKNASHPLPSASLPFPSIPAEYSKH
jgi:hypothetical protein